jgi:hypothetical protein
MNGAVAWIAELLRQERVYRWHMRRISQGVQSLLLERIDCPTTKNRVVSGVD